MISPKTYPPMGIHLAVDGSEHSFAASQFIHDLPLLSDSEVTALGVLTPRNTPGQSLLLAALDGIQKIIEESSVEMRYELLHGLTVYSVCQFTVEWREKSTPESADMEKRPRHRPKRRYPEAKRQIFVSEQNNCAHCGLELKLRPNWHVSRQARQPAENGSNAERAAISGR